MIHLLSFRAILGDFVLYLITKKGPQFYEDFFNAGASKHEAAAFNAK